MYRLKTFILVAAVSMLAAVSCKTDAPAPESTPQEAVEPETAAEPAVGEETQPDAMTVLTGMTDDCEASTEARAARHAEKPLYDRLGGHDPIMAVTLKIIENHKAEDSPIKDLFEDTDVPRLAEHVVNFVGAGTGGPEEYTGKNMKDAHASMNLTPEQFLAAGEDIMQALAHFEVAENETEEFMCIILSFMDDVIATS